MTLSAIQWFSLPVEKSSVAKYRAYWNENLEFWANYYHEVANGHERFDRPTWFNALYRATAGRIERSEMHRRFLLTRDFIHRNVTPGDIFNDLGCGAGPFTLEAAMLGARVNAVDFAEIAIRNTRMLVNNVAPEATNRVNYLLGDVSEVDLPKADVTLAIGLTCYIPDVCRFLTNVLPKTKLLYCLYIDPDHWANRLRRAIPYLDVRDLQMHSRATVDSCYRKLGRTLMDRQPFATGYLDLVR